MSRRERLFAKGMALHVTQRGNNRTTTFLKPSDYEIFLFFLRLTTTRYALQLHPVRGGIVASPELYRWSSYRAHAFGTPNTLLAPHPVYESLGNLPHRRQQIWRRICGQVVTNEQMDGLRASIRNGVVVGELLCLEYAESDEQT